MAERGENNVIISSSFTSKLVKWRVKEGQEVKERSVLALYEKLGQSVEQKGFITQPKLKSNVNGRIRKLLVLEGDVVPAGKPVLEIEQTIVCEHNTVMKDLCCDCGMDLRKFQPEQDEPSSPTLATVSMIHNIPELKVTKDEAEAVGKKDDDRLLNTQKLALVVDLDQTMIHTTIELVPADMKSVYHFNLPGYPLWYHTKFRPFAHEFLERISKLFELHIFTMGSRMYAHTIARMLDPDESLFGHRIRSRDDCFNAFSKSNDLRSLFPQGDSMVCIIDDRTDVWNNAPNLIKVKPYQFFKGVGDINAPTDKQHETAPDSDSSKAEKETVKESEEGDCTDAMKEKDTQQDKNADVGEVNKKESDNDKIDSEKEAQVDSTSKEDDSCDSAKVDEESEKTCEVENDNKENHKSCQDANKSKDNNRENEVDCDNERALESSNHNNIPKEVESEIVDSEKEKNKHDTSTEKQTEINLTELKNSNNVDSDNEMIGNRMNEATYKNSDKVVEMKADSKDKDTEVTNASDNNNHKDDGRANDAVNNAQIKTNGNQEKISKTQVTEKPPDHVDDDDYLVHLEDVLRRIHDKFYSTVNQIKELKAKGINEADHDIARYCSPGTLTPCTKQIIKELQSEVLKGANIVFTGVIPTNVAHEKSDIWQRTERLGAKVTRHVVCPKETHEPGDVTTHVVAARLGTEKTYRAIKTPGIKLVRPDWLYSCEERWEWVDERLFPVEGIDKYKKEARNQRTPQGTPQGWKKGAKTENNVKVVGNKDEINTDDPTRERTCSSSSADLLMASLHPLLAFSSTEMEAMDKEVEDLMNSSADESDVIGSISGSSSSSSGSRSSSSSSRSSSSSSDEEEEKDKDTTKKRKHSDNDSDNNSKKKRKEELSDESDDYTRRSSPSDDDDDDDGDDGDDMAALLEAELSHD